MSGSQTRVDENGQQFVKVSGVRWFTNIEHGMRYEPLNFLTMEDNLRFNKKIRNNPNSYKKYDNYDAIEVPVSNGIPDDYDGVMGVPITFLDKLPPDQFEIVGASESEGKGFSNGLWDEKSGVLQPLVEGDKTYKRIFIRHIRSEAEEDTKTTETEENK